MASTPGATAKDTGLAKFEQYILPEVDWPRIDRIIALLEKTATEMENAIPARNPIPWGVKDRWRLENLACVTALREIVAASRPQELKKAG